MFLPLFFFSFQIWLEITKHREYMLSAKMTVWSSSEMTAAEIGAGFIYVWWSPA